MSEKKQNMYGDSVKQWNVFKGCKYNCTYCTPSFKRQAKRQKPVEDVNGKMRGCQKCYEYKPHFHKERLFESLPVTIGDQFIWVGSSGDISFIKKKDMELILDCIRKNSNKTFFFQTKNPAWFMKYEFPSNVILGITLETNRDQYYKCVSDAPLPSKRIKDFQKVNHLRKSITIEPILKFDYPGFGYDIIELNPERIYIGYDTKKCNLPEPTLDETNRLVITLKEYYDIKIKTKLMREGAED